MTTGCGTAGAVDSFPQSVIVAQAAPEFFYFQNNANGQNPVAAVNAVTGAYVGPAALGPGFAPAHPGDIVTIYASGFGPTKPGIAPGLIPTGRSPGDEYGYGDARLGHVERERCALCGSGAG